MGTPLWITLIILCIIAIIAGIIFAFYFLQEALIFNPIKLNRDFKFHFTLPFEERWFTINDQVELNAIHFKVERPKGLIFYLHGNAENVKYYGEEIQHLTELGYDIFLYDYRGFGKSTGKIKREREMQRDAKYIYQQLIKEYPEQNVVIYGYSLGTGIASRLASNNNPKALVLETPYFNFIDLIRCHKAYLPADLITKYKFRTDRYLTDVKCPIYLFHGTEDKQIPYKSAIKLNKLHPKSKLVTIEDGTHNDLMSFPEFKEEIRKVLD
tara:strand:- start:6569 stop:7372 length:804 start_codon:yes stop_codon:yes gene_type:complete